MRAATYQWLAPAFVTPVGPVPTTEPAGGRPRVLIRRSLSHVGGSDQNPPPAQQPPAPAQAPATTPPPAATAAPPTPPPDVAAALAARTPHPRRADREAEDVQDGRQYPLTLNSLLTGCNQKSNRDPVVDLDEVEVEEGLTALQKRALVSRITGGRVERFRHNLYEAWTETGRNWRCWPNCSSAARRRKGDLRGRAGRMDPIDTLDALEAILKSLRARRLVVYLSEPERRGARRHARVPPAGGTRGPEGEPGERRGHPGPAGFPGVPGRRRDIGGEAVRRRR